MLNPPVNGKIQGFFTAFECFSSTFQGKFNFQRLFKTALYSQVLFKPERMLKGLRWWAVSVGVQEICQIYNTSEVIFPLNKTVSENFSFM